MTNDDLKRFYATNPNSEHADDFVRYSDKTMPQNVSDENQFATKSDVKANPDDSATAVLSKLKVNNTVYSVSGSGIDVEANPDEDASATLTKLKVGATVYDIPAEHHLYQYYVEVKYSGDANTSGQNAFVADVLILSSESITIDKVTFITLVDGLTMSATGCWNPGNGTDKNLIITNCTLSNDTLTLRGFKISENYEEKSKVINNFSTNNAITVTVKSDKQIF